MEIKILGKLIVFEVFVFGLIFSFGWIFCIGLILVFVLVLLGDEGFVFYGVLMMFVYVLGLVMLFVLFLFFLDSLLKCVKGLNKYLDKFKIVGGVLIIVMGILLIMNNFL